MFGCFRVDLSVLTNSRVTMPFLGYLDMRWGFAGYDHLIALGTPLPFVFAPLLYLYVVALTAPLQRLRARALVHALPFFANCIFMAEVFYFQSGAEKLDIAERFLAGDIPAAVRIFQAIMVVQSVAYLAASFWALRRYGERIRTFFSDLHRIDLRWLMVLVVGNAAVWGLVAVATGLQQTRKMHHSPLGRPPRRAGRAMRGTRSSLAKPMPSPASCRPSLAPRSSSGMPA